MTYFYSQKEYEEYEFKSRLRRDANGIGLLLILFLAGEFVFSFAYSLIMVANGYAGDVFSETMEMLLLNGLYSLIIFFFIGIIFCLIRRESFSSLFPFEKAGAGLIAMLVVIGLTFSLLSNYVSDFVSQMFGMFGYTSSYSGSTEASTPMEILASYLTIAVIPALVEEFAFRGIIMGILRKHSDAMALIVSSAIFGLIHGNIIQIPFAFCGGLLFGFMVLKTNSLLPGILIHFFNNALSVTLDLMGGYWGMSEDLVNIIFCIIIIVLWVLSIFFIYRITKTKKDFLSFHDSDRVIPFRQKMRIVCTSPTLIVSTVMIIIYTVVTEAFV